MKLTVDERELLEMAWDDWIGLVEIYPQITIHHMDGRIVEIRDPAPGLRELIKKGLVDLCFYVPARREYREVGASEANALLSDQSKWQGSDDRELPVLGFVITEKGCEVMQAIWAEGNMSG